MLILVIVFAIKLLALVDIDLTLFKIPFVIR